MTFGARQQGTAFPTQTWRFSWKQRLDARASILGDGLLDIVRACKRHLPTSALHMLSNGRLFRYLSLAQRLASVAHPDLVVGVPLYSDLAARHDFVVQAKGAFDDTVRGVMNLLRCGVRVELRVVLHKLTVERLPALARFIGRNLPSVEHVALMGLEMMGYVKMNLEQLWIDPWHYRGELVSAIRELAYARVNASIYNHQLCVLPQQLWPYARKSISDWKNEYIELCDRCAVKDQCGGFFASARLRHSRYLRAIIPEDTTCPIELPPSKGDC